MYYGEVPRYRCGSDERMISLSCSVPLPAREGRKLSRQPKFGRDRAGYDFLMNTISH